MSMISPQRLKKKYESITEEDMATSGTFGGSGSTDLTSNYRSQPTKDIHDPLQFSFSRPVEIRPFKLFEKDIPTARHIRNTSITKENKSISFIRPKVSDSLDRITVREQKHRCGQPEYSQFDSVQKKYAFHQNMPSQNFKNTFLPQNVARDPKMNVQYQMIKPVRKREQMVNILNQIPVNNGRYAFYSRRVY